MSTDPASCPHFSPIQPAAPSPAPAQAVVLVGGRGSRLGALTDSTPKPLLPVGARPFLDHLLEEITRHGIAEVLLLCGYRAEAVRARYDGTRVNGARVSCLVEPEPLGTGGALAFARRHGRLAERFFVLNGDSLFDLNLHDLARLQARAGTRAAVALRQVPDTGRYGRVTVDGERVTAWAEKTGDGPGAINAGVYVVSASAIDALPAGASSLERDLFARLAARGDLAGATYGGFFIDIGVPADLARAQTALPQALRRPTAFLDRDGTLNVDHGYVHTPATFDWMNGAKQAVKRLNDRGYRVVVVTNQAGVAHGYYDTGTVDALHAWMQRDLIAAGAHVDAIAYCPHHPQGRAAAYARTCCCRKPGPGMIEAALAAWPTDRANSFLIGDRPGDLQAAESAGISARLVAPEGPLTAVEGALGACGPRASGSA